SRTPKFSSRYSKRTGLFPNRHFFSMTRTPTFKAPDPWVSRRCTSLLPTLFSTTSMHRDRRRMLLHIALFVATFVTTTFAGAQWAYGYTIFSGDYTWQDFASGFAFSVPLLLILTV